MLERMIETYEGAIGIRDRFLAQDSVKEKNGNGVMENGIQNKNPLLSLVKWISSNGPIDPPES